MTLYLHQALEADYSEYKKELEALEAEKKQIQKNMADLDKKYSSVLELLGKKTAPKRRKRGKAKIEIRALLATSGAPLKAIEIVNALSSKVNEGAIRQSLAKMVEKNEITKNPDKTYELVDGQDSSANTTPKIILRKKTKE